MPHDRVAKPSRTAPQEGEAWRAKVLTVDTIIEILRTTVPRLEDLTDGISEERLQTAPDDGWSVNDVLAHLRTVHYVLGGNMLRIVREDHPAWKGAPGWKKQAEYAKWRFRAAFDGFRAQRAELLEALDPLPLEAWKARTATVSVPPNKIYERSALYYGDWMARHERGHVKHIARILKQLSAR